MKFKNIISVILLLAVALYVVYDTNKSKILTWFNVYPEVEPDVVIVSGNEFPADINNLQMPVTIVVM